MVDSQDNAVLQQWHTMITVNHSDPLPIWRQIEDALRRLVASGRLPPGSPVSSVRDLARELRVNPATVSRAYQRLSDGGVLVVRRGEGTFVAEKPPHIGRVEKRQQLKEAAEKLAAMAITMGATLDEVRDHLDSAFQRLERSSLRKTS